MASKTTSGDNLGGAIFFQKKHVPGILGRVLVILSSKLMKILIIYGISTLANSLGGYRPPPQPPPAGRPTIYLDPPSILGMFLCLAADFNLGQDDIKCILYIILLFAYYFPIMDGLSQFFNILEHILVNYFY